MLYCPKCGESYGTGQSECTKCHLELLNVIAELPENEIVFEEEVYLTSVADINEANILIAKLNTEDIPVLFKYKGISGAMQIYMNFSQEGIDIYVPLSLLDKAKEIIKEEENTEDEEPMEVSESMVKYKSKLSVIAWVLIVVLGLPFFIGILRLVYTSTIKILG